MGPGDRAFVRWVTRYVNKHDAKHILRAYKDARLIDVDNRTGAFHVLDVSAIAPAALEAAAENLRPLPRKKWNQLTDEERQRLVATKMPLPDQWAKQERAELALIKLSLRVSKT